MKSKLRGKKTLLRDFKEHFTKVPNIILHAKGLTPIEKLILIELQSYAMRSNYILAYSRMASDLHVDKSNLITRWHGLIKRGIILDGDRYSIDYDLLIKEDHRTNLTSEDGSQNLPEQSNLDQPAMIGTDYLNDSPQLMESEDCKANLSEEGSQNLPEQSSLDQPAIVGTDFLNSSLELPTEEENKEEEEQSKNKEQEEFLLLLESEFKENENDVSIDVVSSEGTQESEVNLIATNSCLDSKYLKQEINSFEDFKKFFNDNQLRELSSKSPWGIIQATDHLFSNASYDLQMSIATQLKSEYNYPQLDSSKARNDSLQPTGSSSQDAYDFLPWG